MLQEIIVVWQTVTRVPRKPNFVEGIIDLRKRFELRHAEIGALMVGLVVDAVPEVMWVAGDQIEPPSGSLPA